MDQKPKSKLTSSKKKNGKSNQTVIEELKRIYMLPIVVNEKTTTSRQKYVAAWQKIYKPIEKATNSKCFRYDPGCSFITKDQRGTYTFSLGTYEAYMISDTLTKKGTNK